MSSTDVLSRRLRRVEYEQLVDAGFLDDEPIELLDGLMVFREPHSPPHSTAIQLAQEALRAASRQSGPLRGGSAS
jgi:hypothetical protein